MTYSAHQLELLALVHMSEDPLIEAVEIRRRWDYIGQVARAKRMGITLDRSLPQVTGDPELYIQRSEEACAVLREFLKDYQPAVLAKAT